MFKPGAILLDRDGTIIVERHYLSDPELVELEAGAVEGLQKLTAAGWKLVVVTNQSGVARGYFNQDIVDAVNSMTHRKLKEHGIVITQWLICPHSSEDACVCRKPKPGLALEAARLLDIDLRNSWVIGDKLSDVGLATAMGGKGILVRTGHASTMDEAEAIASKAWVADNLKAAAEIILQQSQHPKLPR